MYELGAGDGLGEATGETGGLPLEAADGEACEVALCPPQAVTRSTSSITGADRLIASPTQRPFAEGVTFPVRSPGSRGPTLTPRAPPDRVSQGGRPPSCPFLFVFRNLEEQ